MERKQKPLWREYLETIVLAVTVAVFMRVFVVSVYRVGSESMEDGLLTGDFIYVNKLAFSMGGEPQRDDVIVFKYPLDMDMDFIKRIIGLPGDTIVIRQKQVYVNGVGEAAISTIRHDDTVQFSSDSSYRDNYGPYIVPDSQYFVLGDNRDNSRDSRFWGCVPRQNIYGKAVMIYFSWNATPQHWYSPSHVRASRIFTTL